VVLGLLMEKAIFNTTATMLVPTLLVQSLPCLKRANNKCANKDMAAHLGLE
jgi:hypothetical protein